MKHVLRTPVSFPSRCRHHRLLLLKKRRRAAEQPPDTGGHGPGASAKLAAQN